MGAEVIGLKDLNPGLTITWLALVLPCTFSEPIALEIVDKTSTGYLGAQLFAGFMYIAACICLLGVRVWKIGDMERGAAKVEYSSHDNSSSPWQQSSIWKRLLSFRKV